MRVRVSDSVCDFSFIILFMRGQFAHAIEVCKMFYSTCTPARKNTKEGWTGFPLVLDCY